jgi:hypothetical protein
MSKTEIKYAMSAADAMSQATLTKAKWMHAKRAADELRARCLSGSQRRVDAESVEEQLRKQYEQELEEAVASRRLEFTHIANSAQDPMRIASARAQIIMDDELLVREIPRVYFARKAEQDKVMAAHIAASRGAHPKDATTEVPTLAMR